MKHIKRYMVFVCLAMPMMQFAQMDVRDVKLNGQRALMLGEVVIIEGERVALGVGFKQLSQEEKVYQQKINAIGNFRSTLIYVGLTDLSLSIKSLIKNLEDQVLRIERIPFFLRHGIKDIKADLAREKAYYQKADANIAQSLIDAVSAGGAGYNYTNFLKMFLQMRRIKSKLQEVQYRLDNSGTVNKIFKQ